MWALGMALALGAGSARADAAAERPEVRIGVLAYRGAERAVDEFSPTLAHLNRALPQQRFVPVPLDPAALAAAVAGRALDFVITNPGDHLQLAADFGLTRLATLEGRGSAATVASTVIAPARLGHPVRLDQLQGRRLAIVSAEAFGGWRVIWRELQQAGLGPKQLPALLETGYPMTRIVDALRDGKADAGVLRSCLLEELVAQGQVLPGEFIVVGERKATSSDPSCRRSSRAYPDWPFARLPHTAPELAKRVTAQLLAMGPAQGQGWTAAQDDAEVQALFRELRIGPYEYLNRTTLRDLARDYWGLLAVLALGLLWWLVHAARVERLVRRRTQELTLALRAREAAEREARRHREERDQFARLGMLGEMASNIAHEFNQPLAAIANYAGGIQRALDQGRAGPDFIRSGAQGIAEQAERAAAIIRRIRGYVRRRGMQPAPQDLNALVAAAARQFEPLAQLRGVRLELTPQAGLPPVLADAMDIEQLLIQLLQNATDAMTQGDTPAARRRIEIATRRLEGAVEVAVHDQGPGLSAEVEGRLFDAFFTTKPQGLGLGLSICRTIVERHGGRLWADGAEPPGATFRFTLPLAEETRPGTSS